MSISSKSRKRKSRAGRREKDGKPPHWFDCVFGVLRHAHGPLALSTIYDRVERNHAELTRRREHWRPRVRATLEGSPKFARVAPGVWDLSDRHSKKAIQAFEKERRERYPLRSESAS